MLHLTRQRSPVMYRREWDMIAPLLPCTVSLYSDNDDHSSNDLTTPNSIHDYRISEFTGGGYDRSSVIHL